MKVFDVEGSVEECDGVAWETLGDEVGQGEERDEVALGHVGEHDDVLARHGRGYEGCFLDQNSMKE